jgi:hypothetical protein
MRTRINTLNAAASILEAAGYRVEVHCSMTEYFVIRGASNGVIYIAGTNLATWEADAFANEDALDNGIGSMGAGFSTTLSSASDNAQLIAATLLTALSEKQ